MMDKEVFSVFHVVFFENVEMPLFAFKILTKYLGYAPVHSNAHRVMLLERTTALRIFGYAPGFNTLRCGYFLCYTSYALSNKKTHKDVKELTGYTRKKFLRYRGDMPEQDTRKRLKM